jgi:hypothetical protein
VGKENAVGVFYFAICAPFLALFGEHFCTLPRMAVDKIALL